MDRYGGGTPCDMEGTVLSKILTGFTSDDLRVSPAEKSILRRLSEKVAELAGHPKMQEKRDLWINHNMLQKSRPVVFCDPEYGWNEIITERQMKCTTRIARRWEMDLRKEIFWGEEMGDDKPVEPYFDVPYTVAADDWGVNVIYHQTDRTGSYVWENAIKNYKTDLKKLHYPEVKIDWETTRGCLDLAEDILGDILKVRLKGVWWWSLGLTYPVVLMRGPSNIYYDFIDNPDGLKELLAIVSDGLMRKVDFLEKNNLLSLNTNGTYVGSGGFGYTRELPHKDFNGKHVRCVDMWGFSESQETAHVSPEMYEEFIFPFEKPLLDRFGLNCYGCCEPLDSRWHVVKRHENLRRVSCSPWVDIEKVAEYLEDKYILSRKPNPAILAAKEINKPAIRAIIRKEFEITKDCIIEMIMKDNHTIGRNPENVIEWCRIAREEAENYE